MANGTLIIIVGVAVLLGALLAYLAVSLASARKDKVDTVVLMEALKAQMTAESEHVLKERERELENRARVMFESLAGGLDRNLKDMKEAFEQNRRTHVETSQTLKENIDLAVRNLREQTMSIGDKADSLADALRGRNKAQGNWGEVILDNLFTSEGLREGRDYDKEETLRDERGNVILNEDTDRRMRPDFILHYPDGNDIVVDSKVVLTAMYDYYSADDDTAKADAMARNLMAMKEQVRRLARKDYSRYLRPGHKMMDYVVMFVPVYSALRLAYEADQSMAGRLCARGSDNYGRDDDAVPEDDQHCLEEP